DLVFADLARVIHRRDAEADVEVRERFRRDARNGDGIFGGFRTVRIRRGAAIVADAELVEQTGADDPRVADHAIDIVGRVDLARGIELRLGEIVAVLPAMMAV